MDGVSIGSVLAALTGALPTLLTVIATAMAIIWYALMIADWVRKRREERAALLAEEVIAKAALVAAEVKNEAEAVATRLLAQTEAAKRAASEAAANAYMAELNCTPE